MERLLKVGDNLKSKDLKTWTSMGENRYSSDDGLRKSISHFVGDRTVEDLVNIDGIDLYLVSGTHGICVRANGYIGNPSTRTKKEINSEINRLKEELNSLPEEVYKVGERFTITGSSHEYILARTSSAHFALISLENGERWNNPLYLLGTGFTLTEYKMSALLGSKTIEDLKRI